ncbi:MAG TPA: hypothetical protein VFX96_04490, partial [Pyrinomonadaceae bacterium]|nr:hypothetical protein [Pyrinomonadaceae bacterium]
MTRHTFLRALMLAFALVCVASDVSAQTRTPKGDAGARPPLNEKLRRELLCMYEAEQAARATMQDGVWPDAAERREIESLDAANTKRLTEIFRRHGFPGVRLVGKD